MLALALINHIEAIDFDFQTWYVDICTLSGSWYFIYSVTAAVLN